jgi:hypothetical protein
VNGRQIWPPTGRDNQIHGREKNHEDEEGHDFFVNHAPEFE